jgi:phosphohistidine phosphatase
MKRLFLLRHAKSQRDEAKNDKDRSLNARGRGDAPKMGSYMQLNGYLPDRVLCSSAKRTAETWTLLAPELKPAPPIKFLDALYLAPAGSIVRVIREEGEKSSALLVIGHNPGLEDAARDLAAKPSSAMQKELLARLEDKFPTGALVVLQFEINAWPDMREGSGKLVAFARPKDVSL